MSKTHIIIHCSATPPTHNWTANDVDRAHRAKGWRMNGYHEVITRDGERQNAANGHKCRPLDMPGAHVGDCGAGWNKKSIGICLIGGVDQDMKPEANFTEDQIAAVIAAVHEYMDKFQIPQENVIGHRDLIKMTGAPAKACPCFDVQLALFGNDIPFTKGAVKESKKGDPLAVPKTHVVRKGESLWSLSRLYGVSVDELRQVNNLVHDTDLIVIGQELIIPS